MPTANDAIIQSLAGSGMLIEMFTADLKPEEYVHRACKDANTAAWTLGHLILTERRCLSAAGVTDLPALPDGFEKRFGRDPEAVKATDFGDVSILVPLFKRQRELLVDAARKATPEQLDKPLEKPHRLFSTLGQMMNFMALHVAMHAGQISTIRRSLGRPPAV